MIAKILPQVKSNIIHVTLCLRCFPIRPAFNTPCPQLVMYLTCIYIHVVRQNSLMIFFFWPNYHIINKQNWSMTVIKCSEDDRWALDGSQAADPRQAWTDEGASNSSRCLDLSATVWTCTWLSNVQFVNPKKAFNFSCCGLWLDKGREVLGLPKPETSAEKNVWDLSICPLSLTFWEVTVASV